jgi:hypothetical protein
MADPGSKREAEAALIDNLAHAQRLHAQRAANPILAGALDRLADWQSRRLARTYADFAAQPRYREAVAFFRSDLYGAEEIAQRDADLARVVPIMVRLLPTRAIATLAQAMELNVLSFELDRLVLERLPRADASFTVAEYSRAYRRAGNLPQRRRQIDLIVEIGTAIDALVVKPMVRRALSLMARPARAAGFASLQLFLERGFDAFRKMDGAAEFLEAVRARETAIMEAIIAGDTEPFPDPLNRLGLEQRATSS